MTSPPFAAPPASALQAYRDAREALITACMDDVEDQLRAGVSEEQVTQRLVQAGVPDDLVPAIIMHASD